MKHYFLKTTIILIICIIFSCAKIRQPYIISNLPEIQNLEETDHQSCINLKLNFDKANNIDSKLYWHCRISFAKFHLEINPKFPWQIDFNKKISDLIANISIKISRSQETSIEREIIKIDESDHKKCLRLGYDPESKDQSLIEDYYLCRKNIIELDYSEPPYSNNQYSKYQNKSYDINYVIDKRIKDSIKNAHDTIEKYPECSMYRVTSIDFEKCVNGINDFKKCIKEAGNKINDKESAEKVICQRQAYIRFSDEMIKDEDRVDIEIRNRNLNADRENKNSFSSLGINEKDFLGKNKKATIENLDLQKKSKKQNDTNNIYSKQEISKLRKNFITNCLKIIDEGIEKYEKELNQQCEKLKYRN